MDVFIKGAGWITPLGAELEPVYDAVLAGAPPLVREIPGPGRARRHRASCIPPKLVDCVARQPRLRRCSNISLFSAAAVLAALRDAELDPASLGRCALIFAASDGGVIYTRKFYDQVVREGTGSPLLFPETVYNAPGSHVAALLGLDGITYTVVGDAAAGLAALRLGVELLATGEVDHCIVAGAEEADWILCEAYTQWRLAATGSDSQRGALIADGAAAVVLGSSGTCRVEWVTNGVPFFRQAEAESSLASALGQLPCSAMPSTAISSANGTFIDSAERAALEFAYGQLPAIRPKSSLGDAFGASALMQVICAVQTVRRDSSSSVLVPVIGLNHEAAAALITGRF